MLAALKPYKFTLGLKIIFRSQFCGEPQGRAPSLQEHDEPRAGSQGELADPEWGWSQCSIPMNIPAVCSWRTQQMLSSQPSHSWSACPATHLWHYPSKLVAFQCPPPHHRPFSGSHTSQEALTCLTHSGDRRQQGGWDLEPGRVSQKILPASLGRECTATLEL